MEVVRSPRRRKTVQAREVDGVLRVSIPASMTQADEARWVAEMVRRMERRTVTSEIDLPRRAAQLSDRYGLSRPATIRWADNQEWRWGSCTPSDGSVRISSRLASEPAWVLDYVIVHELAHLDVPRHGPAFWALVAHYPLAERARGFLIARSLHPDSAAPRPELPLDDGADAVDGGAELPPEGSAAPPPRRAVRRGPEPRRAAAEAQRPPSEAHRATPEPPDGRRGRNRRGPATV